MTLISFFDEDPVDNIGDLVFYHPARCIFVGPDIVMRKRRRENIRKFVEGRGWNTELEFVSVPAGDLEAAVEILRQIVDEYPDCVFDVTGGTELMLCAAGIITGSYDIPMYQRKGQTDRILWQYGCEMESVRDHLSVREAVTLHSASVFDSDIFEAWEVTDAFRRDVACLWEIANNDASAWNNTCDAFAALDNDSEGEDLLEVAVVSQAGHDAAMEIDERVLLELMNGGFILDFDGNWGGMSFRFRDMQIKRILCKAGNLLELYTCLAADFADDWDVGVPLDWDGIPQPYGVMNTCNEVDVMLTVGITPVFISCKNGICNKEALYELQTLAEHFGGRFARKILVATYINYNENARNSTLQRAKDMGIILIADTHKISMEAFSARLREAVKDLLPEN